MREVWLTPAGNLRVYRQEPHIYTSHTKLAQYFVDVAERRYLFVINYGYQYLGEL